MDDQHEGIEMPYRRKATQWTLAYNLVLAVAITNIAAFLAWCFNLYKPPFEFVYGQTALGMWISIGAQVVITLAISQLYHGSRHYHAMAELEEVEAEINEMAAAKKR